MGTSISRGLTSDSAPNMEIKQNKLCSGNLGTYMLYLLRGGRERGGNLQRVVGRVGYDEKMDYEELPIPRFGTRARAVLYRAGPPRSGFCLE